MNKYAQTPEYEIDLHGMNRAEAKGALLELFNRGKKAHVRIITGKGIYRENGGVLRDFVKTFLDQNGVRYNPSKQSDGGDGAFEVFFD